MTSSTKTAHKPAVIRLLAGLFACLVLPAIASAGAYKGTPPAAASQHQNQIRISAKETARRVTIGLNKSMIVRLPRGARDVLISGPKKVSAVIRTPYRSYLIGKEVGQTNVFYFDGEGRQILNLEVRVERDIGVLRSMFRRLMPDSRIDVEALNDSVVITGTVPNAAQAKRAADIASRMVDKPEKVLNMLSVSGKEQVLLKVTVAEMQRSILKQLGVDLTTALNISNAIVNFSSVNPFSIAGTPLTGTTAAAAYSKNGNTISSTLRAMERDGLLRTLAEPTLTAISGEAAKFLAGGEFPVPASRDRDGNVTVSFKPFGVGLGFTPIVLSEGRISLKISTEVSELSSEGAFTVNDGSSSALTIPALKVRRAQTTVEMPSGGSLVMAGLIQENARQSLNGLPGIKDVPIIGALFRSRDFQRSETELVVIVTPYLVTPVNRRKLIRPDHNFTPPHDSQTILLGRLNKVYGVAGKPVPKGRYQGDIGFIVE